MILRDRNPAALDVDAFTREWGIDFRNHSRGGVTGVAPRVAAADPTVWLLQHKTDSVGATLGRTTGWTHRLMLTRSVASRCIGGAHEAA